MFAIYNIKRLSWKWTKLLWKTVWACTIHIKSLSLAYVWFRKSKLLWKCQLTGLQFHRRVVRKVPLRLQAAGQLAAQRRGLRTNHSCQNKSHYQAIEINEKLPSLNCQIKSHHLFVMKHTRVKRLNDVILWYYVMLVHFLLHPIILLVSKTSSKMNDVYLLKQLMYLPFWSAEQKKCEYII